MAHSDGAGTIEELKAGLRDEMRRARAGIEPEERDRLASSVERRLLDLATLGEPRTVMVFASFGSEVPTEGIVRRLAAEGHTVLLPIVDGTELRAVRYRPGDPLQASSYGPLEPSARTPADPEGIDIVITPGLAFDRTGARLGYGGAFYDRFLSRLATGALTIGIGFHRQLVPAVPSSPKDVRVDLVVTDREVVTCRPDGTGER